MFAKLLESCIKAGKNRLFFTLVLSLLFLSPAHALLIKGKIEVAKGRVYIYRNGRVLQAVDDMNIYTGDLIESSRHGSLLIEMMDMGLLKVKPNTQLKFPENDMDQIQVSRLQVKFGEVWVKIRKLTLGEVFELKTPDSVALVSGSIVTASYDKRKRKNTFSVIEGDVEVHKDQNHYFLTAGDKLALDHRRNSMARRRRIDIYEENKKWKKVVTIREKLGRKIREGMHLPSSDGKTDYEAPVVHIVEPLEGVPLKSRKQRFRATIYEDHLSRLVLTVNGKVIKDVESGLKNYTQEIYLKPGENEIELKAIDRYGNVGIDRRKIKISELPPVISIFSPFDGQDLKTRFVTIQGVVDDSDVREVVIWLNNRKIARDRAVPTFTIPIILDIGENLIRVEATNGVGLTGVREITAYTGTEANLIIELNPLLK